MAKSKLGEAADAAKTIAGAALGAAAIAATGVLVTRVAEAIQNGGKQLEDATPRLQKMAAQTVTRPLQPAHKRRAASRKASAAKAKAGRRGGAAKRAAGKRRTARRKAAR